MAHGCRCCVNFVNFKIIWVCLVLYHCVLLYFILHLSGFNSKIFVFRIGLFMFLLSLASKKPRTLQYIVFKAACWKTWMYAFTNVIFIKMVYKWKISKRVNRKSKEKKCVTVCPVGEPENMANANELIVQQYMGRKLKAFNWL